METWEKGQYVKNRMQINEARRIFEKRSNLTAIGDRRIGV